MCGKEWMRVIVAGRKPHYCKECAKIVNHKRAVTIARSKAKTKRIYRSYEDMPPLRNMIRWLPAKPLTDYLDSKVPKDKDDWGVPNQPKKTYFDEMGAIIGVDDAGVRVLCQPGKLISAYKADEFAIRAGMHPMNIWGFTFYADEPEGGSNPTGNHSASAKAAARERQIKLWQQEDYRKARAESLGRRDKPS